METALEDWKVMGVSIQLAVAREHRSVPNKTTDDSDFGMYLSSASVLCFPNIEDSQTHYAGQEDTRVEPETHRLGTVAPRVVGQGSRRG